MVLKRLFFALQQIKRVLPLASRSQAGRYVMRRRPVNFVEIFNGMVNAQIRISNIERSIEIGRYKQLLVNAISIGAQ